jgi:hypothetical protein
MVVRVSVVAPDAAAGLMQSVRCEVTVAQVEFDAARQEVRIEIEKQPDETLVEVLNLLENWLGMGGRPPTSVEIDDHRYLLGAVG